MPLPKISHPILEMKIPSTETKIKLRPMLTREEKILLMAKESQETNDIMSAIKQVVNNCIVTEGVDVDQLTTFDLEMLFVKLRSFSIDKIVNVSYIDNEDQQKYDFDIDLETIEIRWPDKFKTKEDRTVKIDDNVAFTLRYPRANLYSDEEFLSLRGQDVIEYLARNVIETVYSGTSAIPFQKESEEDQKTFVSDLPIKTFETVNDFLSNLPSLYHVIKYKNQNGSDRKIEMTTLKDFFSLD